MRRAGASRMESMPSMARGSPWGIEPGEDTGTECTSPPSSRNRSIPSHCSATLAASQGGTPQLIQRSARIQGST
eukprot:8607949-Alexandrium_andersonii.AAC.1